MEPNQNQDPFIPKDGYGQVLFGMEYFGRKVIRLAENRVMKWGPCLDRRKTDAMEFIAHNTTIPVPKVYQTRFNERWTGNSEIVMDYMPGEQLDKVWKTLNHDQKVSICSQLGEYLSQLKKLTGKHIESMNGGQVTVGIRLPREGGPFSTEKEFNKFLVEEAHKRVSGALTFYSSAGLSDNHKIHFAHGDFAPRNILVDKNHRVTAVLDWEKSGWFPEYWDVNRILCESLPRGMPDYHDYFRYIHSYEYVSEYLAMKYILRLSGEG